MATRLGERGVPFLLTNIHAGQEIEPFADRLGIPYVDISVDLSDPRNNNLPYDGHPSAVASAAYAEALARSLHRDSGL